MILNPTDIEKCSYFHMTVEELSQGCLTWVFHHVFKSGAHY